MAYTSSCAARSDGKIGSLEFNGRPANVLCVKGR
jgi:hypothetical protein